MLYGMHETIFHGARQQAGTTSGWYPPDSKELYEKHLKTHYEKLKTHGWIDKQFTYEFNSVGFRTDEFVHPAGIVFLGCSHTLGLGLPTDETYAYHVAKALKLKAFNLGIIGASTSTCFRLALYWLAKLKPKLVVYQIPAEARLEFRVPYTNNSKEDPWVQNCLGSHNKFYKHFIRYREHYILQHYRNLLGIQHICYTLNIKLILLEQEGFDTVLEEQEASAIGNYTHDLARDLAHYGGTTHKNVANLILGKIDE